VTDINVTKQSKLTTSACSVATPASLSAVATLPMSTHTATERQTDRRTEARHTSLKTVSCKSVT